MTPLSRLLLRVLPPWLAYFALGTIYFVLIVFILAGLSRPPTQIIYLDAD